MIDLIFSHGTELILVKVKGSSILFGSTIYGAKMAPIDGIKLDYNGTIREFPDLKDDLDWREKAVQRFKDHISTFNGDEEKIAEYIVYELRTKGYLPKWKQKAGFRPVPIQ